MFCPKIMDGPSTSKRKVPIRRQRRMTSRIVKSKRFGRGRKRRETKQRNITQLIDESMNDENTTNSENSEKDGMFNGVQWEENIENDSKLVDEFAPRIVASKFDNTVDDNVSSVEIPEQPDNSENCQKFKDGLEIYVRKPATDNWRLAVVSEVDVAEGQVLLHYLKEDILDEWVFMDSKSISKTNPVAMSDPVIAASCNNVQKSIDEKMRPLNAEVEQKSLDDKYTDEEAVIRRCKPPVPRSKQRGGWKRKRSVLSHSNTSLRDSKFVIGEQVLAKWSDHRMQKFPAVIKTIVGDGRYDVLFYDGFEKTLTEEHLFKTTEEEVAKYQQTNPSEADTFIDMDADSKEARRQRKKKTFDDYVFAKEIKTKRRALKSGECFGLTKKVTYGKASESKDVNYKPLSRKKMRRRRRALFVPKKDISRGRLYLPAEVNDANMSKPSLDSQDSENFYGFDDIVEAKPPEPLEEDPIVDPNWRDNTFLDLKPINITGNDGIVYKSVVVPDKNLPDGWHKHSVLKPNDVWEIFLLSPDGYQISNEEELKLYYGTLPDGGEAPPELDFQADFDLLPKLMAEQKELLVAGTPKVWQRRKPVRGGRRGGRGHYSSAGRSIGRVRTLLPKCKVESPPSSAAPTPLPPTADLLQQTPITSGSESELWKCPKEKCDKKFRKESLLQMHIKHYHRELSSLVRSIPNMVDIACARSESVNSTPDISKGSQNTLKRILPRPFCSSPNNTIEESQVEPVNSEPPSPLLQQGTSRVVDRPVCENVPLKRKSTGEERRTTIKTIFPIRPDLPSKGKIDSDDLESEDEYIEQKKNGSRIFKAGKYRRSGKITTGSKSDEQSTNSSLATLPTFKFTKNIKQTDKLQSSIVNYDSYTEEEKLSPCNEVNEDGVIIERLKSEEFINCACGFREEDGLMIQCDICTCWQHGHCSGIETEADVPERYVCSICRNPYRVRKSKKYSYSQLYLTQGKLPTFSYRSRNEEDLAQKEMILKRSFDLKSSIHEIRSVDRSLSAKVNVIEKVDHPKLYMWSKNWEELELRRAATKLDREFDDISMEDLPEMYDRSHSGPKPETPIDLEECRLRLLNDIESGYSQLEDRLTSLQTQVAALESLDPDDLSNPTSEKAFKQSVQILLRDLATVQKLATINCQPDSQV